jgi:CpeT protein
MNKKTAKLLVITLCAGACLPLASCGQWWKSDKRETKKPAYKHAARKIRAQTIGLMRFEQFLTGSFSSYAQSQRDPEFYEIVLNMVPIWEDRDDGPWLYVEQAVASNAEQPYRQRVYHLEQIDKNSYSSSVYSFENPEQFAGAYRDEMPLAELTPEDLSIRVGCAIVVSWDEDQRAFVGSTNGRDCQSELRGASYATSQVLLRKDRLVTWDRGYDANGEQVWGAVKGGYVFDRVSMP